jgi:hypothetical protein
MERKKWSKQEKVSILEEAETAVVNAFSEKLISQRWMMRSF